MNAWIYMTLLSYNDGVTRRLEDTYKVPNGSRHEMAGRPAIEPDHIKVVAWRATEAGPWDCISVHVHGPQFLKDGSIGIRWQTHHYNGETVKDAPLAIHELVVETLNRAKEMMP